MSGEILSDDQHDGTEPELVEEPVAGDRKRTRLLIGGAALVAIALATTVRNSPAVASQVSQYLPASFVAASSGGDCGQACPLSQAAMASTSGSCCSSSQSQGAALASSSGGCPSAATLAAMNGTSCCSSQPPVTLASAEASCCEASCCSGKNCTEGVCPFSANDESTLAADDRPIEVQLTAEL